MEYPHRPVLLHEVVSTLVTVPDGLYVDGTVGSGGHSEAIGKKIRSKGRLICLDRDSEAVRVSKERLAPLGNKVTVIKANYARMDEILRGIGIDKVHGILLDLGMSTFQIEGSGRGFSFNRDEPLDMRMDLDESITARQLINTLPAKALENILKQYGEERRARNIAKSIEKEREKGLVRSSGQLANLILAVVPRSYRPGAKHPATRTFQALRIAVNKELDNLNTFLETSPSLVLKGGRVVVLSYHSLEDRIVKQAMMNWERACQCPPDLPACQCGKVQLFRRLYKKGIKPGQMEIDENPRARSAILRAAERI